MVLTKSLKFEISQKKEYSSISELANEYGVSKATISRALRFVKDSNDGLVGGNPPTEKLELSNSLITPTGSNNGATHNLTEESLEQFDLETTAINETVTAAADENVVGFEDDSLSIAEFQPTDGGISSFEQVLNPVAEEFEMDSDIASANGGDNMDNMSGDEVEKFVDGLLEEPDETQFQTRPTVDINELMQNLGPEPMTDVEFDQPTRRAPSKTQVMIDDEQISLVNQVIQYLNEFDEHLQDVYMGQTKKVFVKALAKKHPYELKLLISNIKSTINQKNTQAMMSTAFTSAISATEYIGCEYVGLRINGISDLFNKNSMVKSQVSLCFKELSIKHSKAIEESGVLEPEVKLAMIVAGAVMNLHTQNSLNSGLQKFKDEDVPDEMAEKYGDI
jgi:hypothetical protein